MLVGQEGIVAESEGIEAVAYADVDAMPRWNLDPRVRHLNHGSFGAVPVAVQAEQARLQGLVHWNPVWWYSTLAERVAEARESIADLLNVDRHQLAFVLNASAGASVVYQSLASRRIVNVAVTDHGYGAVTMGAERLAERTGGRFSTIAIPLAASPDEVVELIVAHLDANPVTLLVVDQITSATAREFPVDRICDQARRRGVATLVDGAHAPGMVADPVCRSADYWVGNLHKFACAPRGAAVLVARDGDHLYPLIDSWGARESFPSRFDVQGTLDVTPWLTAAFAWRHIDETIGWDEVRKGGESVLTEGSSVVASALAATVGEPLPDVGQPVALMRLLALPAGLGRDHAAADALRVPFMQQAGAAVAFTSFHGRGYLRLSAHAYTSMRDFEDLATVGIPLLHRWSLGNSGGASQTQPDLQED